MPTDFFALLHRDHMDLQHDLDALLDPTTTRLELRAALDGVRLGLTAHAEAAEIVLARFESVSALRPLVAHAAAAHVSQEGALSELVSSRPGTSAWRETARYLRGLVCAHATHEEATLLPALREYPADYSMLAGEFATQRLRQLAMLQPSAPVFSPYAFEAFAACH